MCSGCACHVIDSVEMKYEIVYAYGSKACIFRFLLFLVVCFISFAKGLCRLEEWVANGGDACSASGRSEIIGCFTHRRCVIW